MGPTCLMPYQRVWILLFLVIIFYIKESSILSAFFFFCQHALCICWEEHRIYLLFPFDKALVMRRCPEDVLSIGTSTYQTCPSELGGSINSGFCSLGSAVSSKRLHIVTHDYEPLPPPPPPPMCKPVGMIKIAAVNVKCLYDL